MISLKQIILEIMGEGLDVSHDIGKAVTLLNKLVSIPNQIAFAKTVGGTNRFKMVARSMSPEQWDKILKIANNLGWFPVNYQADSDWWQRINYHEKDKQKFVDYVNKIGDNGHSHDKVNMYFDAKFDWIVDPRDIGTKAYHTSPAKYKDKILKIGLAPRSKEKFGNQPPRVYLAYDRDDLVMLVKHSAFYPEEKFFTIFEIDLTPLISRGIKFHSDPSWDEYGFYIYKNVPPQYIKAIDTLDKKGHSVENQIDMKTPPWEMHDN